MSADFAEFLSGVVFLVGVVVATIGTCLGRKRLLLTIPLVVVFMTLVLLVSIALPSFPRARSTGETVACINNLRRIQDAKEAWANENHKLPTDIPVESDLIREGSTNKFLLQKLLCPKGGTYTIGAVNVLPKCSLAGKGHRLE